MKSFWGFGVTWVGGVMTGEDDAVMGVGWGVMGRLLFGDEQDGVLGTSG